MVSQANSTFQFWGQINPQQMELYLMHLQNVRKISLHDFLLQGLKLQNDLFAVLL